jgi:hypothetical protein
MKDSIGDKSARGGRIGALGLQIVLIAGLALLAACAHPRPFNMTAHSRVEVDRPVQVIEGRQNWLGPSDCSAVATIHRDKKGITVVITISDDVLFAEGLDPMENDGAAVYFDTRNSIFRGESFQRGVFMARLLPHFSRSTPETIFWYPQQQGYDPSIPDATVESRALSDKQYELRLFLPQESLREYQSAPIRSFYFDLEITDNDGAGNYSRLMWTAEPKFWDKPVRIARPDR